MHGADAAELRRLAGQFRATADDIDSEGSIMTRVLGNVSWLGDVATRFTSDWTGISLPKIGLSTQFLRDAADQLDQNAGEQEQASSGASAGGSGPRGWTEIYMEHCGMMVPIPPKQVMDWLQGASGRIDSSLLLLATLGRPGPLPNWLVDPSDWAAVRMLGTKFQSLIHGGKDHAINGRLGGLTTAFRGIDGGALVKPFGEAAKGAGLSAVIGGLDTYLQYQAHGWGDARTIEAQVDGAISTAASLVPGGSLVYGGTRFIGDAVYGKVDEVFDITGGAVEGYSERTFGVPSDQLTPEQSDQLNQRYYGWSGLWNSNYDVAREYYEDVGDVLIGAHRGVTSIATGAISTSAEVGRRLMGVFR